MKINRTAKSETSAREILEYLQGDEDTTARRVDPIVSLDDEGNLLFYNAACGTDESENVLIERLESDSMGDGWGSESATTDDIIVWLETHCEL